MRSLGRWIARLCALFAVVAIAAFDARAMPVPRQVIFFGGGNQSAPSWTPAKSSPYFVLNPADSSTLTIATGVSRATDDNGGAQVLVQPTASQQPTVDSARLLGKAGYVGLKILQSASQTLTSATGGVTGHADHSICVVAAADYTASYNFWSQFGQPGGSGSVAGPGNAGTAQGNPYQWMAIRGTGPGTPISATPFAADTNPHLLCYVFSSQTISLWVDGVQAISSVSDTGYALAAGFGISGLLAGSYYPGLHLWWSGWWTRALETTNRHLMEAWASKRFQVGTTACLGDSICAGYPAGGTETTLSYLNVDYLTHGTQQFNFGVSGQRTDTILSRVTSVTGLTASGNGVPFVVLLNGGINDAVGYTTASAWTASYSYPAGSSATNAGNLYFDEVDTSGCTSGATAPTCTSGSCSDGACAWKYISANNTSAVVAWTIGNLQAATAAMHSVGAKVLVYPMTPVGTATFGAGESAALAYASALNSALASATWHDGYLPIDSQPEMASAYSCWFRSADQVHPTNTAVCTCPLSSLASWATGQAYTSPLMVQHSSVYYALENASCTSGATAPTCTSGSCSDGACTWDAIPAGADCTVGGYQAIARAVAPAVKALLGM